MSIKDSLEQSILTSHAMVQEYEEILQLSDDPKQKARSQRAIQEQWALIKRYLGDYVPLCAHLNLPLSEQMAAIAHVAGYPLAQEPGSGLANTGASREVKFAVADAHALVIGVGAYTHPRFASLPATVRDAKAVADLLADALRCGYRADHVRLLTDEGASACHMRSALKELSQTTSPDSTVVIYFSGHGGRAWQDKKWRTFLCPREADPDDLAGTAIAGGDFSDLLADIPARKMVVILDACHAAGSANLKAPDGQVLWKAGLSSSYYELLSQGSGRVVLTSSTEDQYSYVRPQGDLSLFTWHLCRGLEGKAAVRGDGLVRVLDLYTYVSESVQADEPKQTPILKVKDMDLNFPIALSSS